MSNNVHQLTQLSCTSCGAGGISPRTETSYDRYTQETVTEAVWICSRCGSRFNSGEVSRVKVSNEKSKE